MTDEQALARAKEWWGDGAFAHCKVLRVTYYHVGNRKTVYGCGLTWEDAFENARLNGHPPTIW